MEQKEGAESAELQVQGGSQLCLHIKAFIQEPEAVLSFEVPLM